MPLLITDDGGNLVYKSRTFPKNGAAFSVAKEEPLVSADGHAAVCKDITVDGRMYHFYIASEEMQIPHGMQYSTMLDHLFSVKQAADEEPRCIDLADLPRLFFHTYEKALRGDGIQLELRKLSVPAVVNVRPNSLLLLLALMVRLCAMRGKHVCLSATVTAEGAAVFADAKIGKGRKTAIPTVLTALLYELAAAAGFQAEYREKNGTATWSLTLCPPDIGLYGFKTAPLAGYQINCELYAAVLLT